MHTLHICDEQCINMWKSYLNACYFATRGQHFHQIYKWDTTLEIFPTLLKKPNPRNFRNLALNLRIWKIKNVKTYLREVLEMKSKKIWLSFERKWCFRLRETRGRQKQNLKKNCHWEPLKNWIFAHFTSQWLARSLIYIGQLSQVNISHEGFARELQDSLYKFVKELKIHFHIFLTWV